MSRLSPVLAALFSLLSLSCSSVAQESEIEARPLPSPWDFDHNGQQDFRLDQSEPLGSEVGTLPEYTFIRALGVNSLASKLGDHRYSVPLEEGFPVAPTLSDSLAWGDVLSLFSWDREGLRGPWIGAGRTFIGVRIGRGATARYGWAEIEVCTGDDEPPRIVLYDYALAPPGETIRTGKNN